MKHTGTYNRMKQILTLKLEEGSIIKKEESSGRLINLDGTKNRSNKMEVSKTNQGLKRSTETKNCAKKEQREITAKSQYSKQSKDLRASKRRAATLMMVYRNRGATGMTADIEVMIKACT